MPRTDVTPTIGCNELNDSRLDAMARAMIRRLQDEGLDAAAANMWVSRAGARVVILDCCFSGAVERIFRYGTAKGDVAVPPGVVALPQTAQSDATNPKNEAAPPAPPLVTRGTPLLVKSTAKQ